MDDPRSRDSADELARYYPEVRRYAGVFARDCSSADDLAQDTYLEALKTLRNSGPPRSPLPWLRSIVHRTAYIHSSEPRHGTIAASRVLDTYRLDPVDELVRAEFVSGATGTLAGLRTRDAALLRDYYWGGQTCAEIGETFATTAGAVKARLYRARCRLRDALSE